MICKSSLNAASDNLQCFSESPHTEDMALPIFSGGADDELDYYGFIDDLQDYVSLKQLTTDEQVRLLKHK